MRKQVPILRGLAIVAVVLYHCAAVGHTAMFYWAHRFRQVESPNFDQFGSLPYYVLLVMQRLAWFAVPAFLFIAGFSMAYATSGKRIGASLPTIRARISLLIWPYLIWSLAIFVRNGILLGSIDSPGEYLQRLVFGRAEPLYYFVPLLIQLYLISPFITRWAKAKPALLLAVAGAIQLGMHILLYLPWEPLGKFGYAGYAWGFWHWAFFFPLGSVCFLHYRRAKVLLARFRWVLLGAAAVTLVVSTWEVVALFTTKPSFDWAHHTIRIPSSLYALAFMLAFVAFDNVRIPFAPVLRWLGTKSYAVYLLHFPAIQALAKCVYRFAPRLLAHQGLYQPLLFAAGLGLPLLLMTVVARSPLRKYYQCLFGTRASPAASWRPALARDKEGPREEASRGEVRPLGVAATRD